MEIIKQIRIFSYSDIEEANNFLEKVTTRQRLVKLKFKKQGIIIVYLGE